MTSLEELDADLDAYIVGDIEFTNEPRTLATIDEADRTGRRIARLQHDLDRLRSSPRRAPTRYANG